MTLIPAFPLGTAFVPGDAVVLRVFESRYLELVRVTMDSDRRFVTSLIAAGSEVGGHDKRFNTGVLVEIDHIETAEFGLMLYGHATIAVNISSWIEDAPYPRVLCEAQKVTVSDSSASESAESLITLATCLEDFFSFLTQKNIAPPSPPGFVSSLVPPELVALTTDEKMEFFWSLVRLLPATPLARYEILVDQPLSDRVGRAVAEIEHLRDIVAFRYGT